MKATSKLAITEFFQALKNWGCCTMMSFTHKASVSLFAPTPNVVRATKNDFLQRVHERKITLNKMQKLHVYSSPKE
jgi:hypothetical protein